MRRYGLGSFLALAAFLGWATPARAQYGAQPNLPSAERFKVRVQYLWWTPQIQGDLQKGAGGIEGTLLDVQSDLGMGTGDTNQLSGAVRLGNSWKLRGSWSPIDFSGDTPATQPFLYGTTLVQAGDQVATSIKGNAYGAGLEWDFTQGQTGFLGLTFGVKYFDVTSTLANATTSSGVTERRQMPIPVVGLTGRVYFRKISLEADVSGMTLGSRGHVWDLLGTARFHLSDGFAAVGGYRKLILQGSDNPDYFHLDLGTWTYGAEISL
ncbi:MAG: hypothetical protein ACHQNV_11010 [Vicinamibacteria bacterium]